MLDSWKTYNLNEVYEFSSGLSKKREQFGYGKSFLTFKDVFNNFFLPDQLTELVNSTEKEREKASIKRGDVFLTRTSETQHELGMSSVALRDYVDATFNGFTKRLRPKGHIPILPEYAGYYFRSSKFRSKVTSLSSMTTRASLNNSMLSILTIDVPPVETQRSIANLLSSFDDKIENNNAVIANLEKQAETIFKSWFVDFEPFLDGKFVESELGEIPQSFKVQCISDFASISSGKRRKNSDRTEQNKYPIVGATKVTGYTDEYLTEDKVIITGRVGTLGSFQLFKSKIWPSDNTLVLKSDLFGFTYFSLKQVNFTALNRGTTQPLVTQTDIKNYKVVLPDINWLNTFESLVEPMIEMYWKLSEQNKKLAEIRDTLLPKLMSGEIRVGDAVTVE